MAVGVDRVKRLLEKKKVLNNVCYTKGLVYFLLYLFGYTKIFPNSLVIALFVIPNVLV